MFPGFSVAISGLKPKGKYTMKLEVVLAENHRFKFLNARSEQCMCVCVASGFQSACALHIVMWFELHCHPLPPQVATSGHGRASAPLRAICPPRCP